MHRLQLLKERLIDLKSKSMCALDHVFKIPPDPGHATDGKCISNDRIYADLEGREETTSSTTNEVQLQTFTCSYVRNQESSFEAQIVLIKGDEMCEQDPSPIAHQKIHLHKLQERCLTLCLMAEEVAKNSPNPGAVESCNEHDTIYAISSDFGDRMTTQSIGLI